MAQLRIFSYLPNPRVWKATIAARFCGVDVEVSEATERFAGSRPVVVERSEHDLALLLGGDVTGEQDSLVREVQSDAAVGVARS